MNVKGARDRLREPVADLGDEIPTALLPTFLTSTLAGTAIGVCTQV